MSRFLEHQCPKASCMRWRKEHRAQVVFGRAGHRVGATLIQPDHRVREGKEEADEVVE